MLLSNRRPLEAIFRHEGQMLSRTLMQRGRYVIGREKRNEIVLDQDSISTRHARLTVVSEAEIYIEDCASANGTLVDGNAIQAMTRIGPGMQIDLGQCSMHFQRNGLPAEVFAHLPEGFLRAHPYLRGEIVVQGRSSTIYEGHDASLDRDVALKVMLPQSQAHPRQVLNFIREAQVTSQLQHPNILPIYELSLDDEKQLFYTTRFMSGDTLARYLEKMAAGDAAVVRRFTLSNLIAVFQKICDGIAFAHAHGVVHGALRPENITVGDFGEVFIMNWTFATILPPKEGQKAGPRVNAPPAMESPPLSAFSAAVQVRGGNEGIDVSVDIHALGGILFKILTLHDPVTGSDDAQMIARILSGHVAIPASLSRTPRPHWPDGRLPEYLVGIAMKALNTNDPGRPMSVLELQELVAAW